MTAILELHTKEGNMRRLLTPSSLSRAVLILVPFLAACGHPEQAVVDRYFASVNAKDNQTLSSFALVSFDQPVERWKVIRTITEKKDTAPLAGLLAAQKAAEDELAKNKTDYTKYRMDHFETVEEVRELVKNDSKIPARLDAPAAAWKGFTDKEKELKKVLSDATSAVEREKRHLSLSVGPMDDLEALEGELLQKDIELELTVAGTPAPYVMGLRKYEVKPASSSAKVLSRWVIVSLAKA
jgi:hypothetical protein